MSKSLVSIIKSEEQYDQYMNEIMQLLESGLTPGTDEFDRFELLNLLVQKYEEQNYPIDKPDPIEAIKFRMDQQGLTQADMRQYIGSASKVSEVLNRKRPLSLSMIRRIHNGLGIPLDVLIQSDATDMEHQHEIDDWKAIGSISGKIIKLSLNETMRLISSIPPFDKDENVDLQNIMFEIPEKTANWKNYWPQEAEELHKISSSTTEVTFDMKQNGLPPNNKDFREMVH